ncbi:MAG TPA: helix-hairpin-helix domain-containing protein [Polyangia bacterium]
MVVLPVSAPRARSVLTFALVLVVDLGSGRARAAGKTVEGVVNLNTAPVELLSALPGIGPSKALGILAYRARRPFRTVDELVRVKGIGRRMVLAMRAHLAVSGPSTARAILSLGPLGAPAGPSVAAPMAPPARGPPSPCRPVAAAPPTTATIARAIRAAQRRSIRAQANHCMPPA